MTFHRFTGVVIAAMFAAVTASSVSCAPSKLDTSNPPAFALTTADVTLTEVDQFPVNLIFVAGLDDEIWHGVTGIEIAPNVTKGPGQFEIVKGDSKGDKALGNLTFTADIPAEGLSFNTVEIFYEGQKRPVKVSVGQWHLNRNDSPSNGLTPTSEEVVSIAECVEARLPVPIEIERITALTTNSTGVEVTSYAFDAAQHEIVADLSCAPDSDFVIFSPEYRFTKGDGSEGVGYFPPISVGFQEIDDADFDKIAKR